MTREQEIVKKCLASACFEAEAAYAEAAGFRVRREVRLYKELEGDRVRVVFPTGSAELEEGSVVAITCLFDRKRDVNTYAHTICAGPGVNVTLKAIHSPLGRATPQPGLAGDKAVLHFVAWKQAAWGRFLMDELELGTKEASALWLRSFWKAMDRLFAGGVLRNCPEDYHWRG
jgi:hypothetical protein